jgi:hypothetical protein
VRPFAGWITSYRTPALISFSDTDLAWFTKDNLADFKKYLTCFQPGKEFALKCQQARPIASEEVPNNMKVTDKGNLFTESLKNQNQKAKPEQSFSEVLIQVAQGPVGGSTGLKADSVIPPLGALDPFTLSQPVQAVSQSDGETSLTAGLIDELETILHAFDHYRIKLGDTSVPVNDLADIIGHFEDRIDRLQVLSSTSGIPQGLREVTSGLMITMATEIEKYKRGDYF